MEKIEFKNYPDTTTPVSADNLNLLQTNVENAVNSTMSRDFVSAYASADGSSSSSFGTVAVNCNTLITQVGTGLTLSGGNIVVGSGISKIKVSGVLTCLFVNANTSNSLSGGARIMKNGNALGSPIVIKNVLKSTTEEVTITIPPTIISVEENDTIGLGIYSSSGYITKTAKSYSLIEAEVYEFSE